MADDITEKIVICPICRKYIPCDNEESCITEVPKHGNCQGRGQVGFVITTNAAKQLKAGGFSNSI